jgi:hypothetical protein
MITQIRAGYVDRIQKCEKPGDLMTVLIVNAERLLVDDYCVET